MIEKVNPQHPDKIADRIAGAIVDLAYKQRPWGKKNAERAAIAVEVLIGHGRCYIISEANLHIPDNDIRAAVERIAGVSDVVINQIAQDPNLQENQAGTIRCGDNGIFRGVPLTGEERALAKRARRIYDFYPYDGKYILDQGPSFRDQDYDRFIICQSNADTFDLAGLYPDAEINPLGDWTGGLDVDTGATNRKLGSDMGRSVTGGGLHGKDLSKADVTLNIYAFNKAQRTGQVVELCCAIGDELVDGIPYQDLVDEAADYIRGLGGFEKFAEWGLI